MQLVLDTKGLTLKVRNKSFHVQKDDRERTISPKKLTSIAVTAGCMLSSQAIRLAAEHGVPIIFYNRMGRPTARLWSPYFGSLAELRRQQAFFDRSKAATDWVISLFEQKLEGQLKNLKWLENRRPSRQAALSISAEAMRQYAKSFANYQDNYLADVEDSLLGTEGNIARTYWQAIAACMPETMMAGGRSRRPARDYFNACLNYLYGMLYPVVESGIFAAGLDPYLGIFHADQYDRPTLAFDLIEPFRPQVDRMLLEICLKDGLEDPNLYRAKGKGIWLSKAGKRILIPLFNDFMEKTSLRNKKRLSNKNHIFRYCQQFANYLKDFNPI